MGLEKRIHLGGNGIVGFVIDIDGFARMSSCPKDFIIFEGLFQ